MGVRDSEVASRLVTSAKSLKNTDGKFLLRPHLPNFAYTCQVWCPIGKLSVNDMYVPSVLRGPNVSVNCQILPAGVNFSSRD